MVPAALQAFVGIAASVAKVAVTIELIIALACFLGWRWVCAGSWALVHWWFERAQVRTVVK